MDVSERLDERRFKRISWPLGALDPIGLIVVSNLRDDPESSRVCWRHGERTCGGPNGPPIRPLELKSGKTTR